MATASRLSPERVRELLDRISRIKAERDERGGVGRLRDHQDWGNFKSLKDRLLKTEARLIENALRSGHSEEAYSDARRSQGVIDRVTLLFERVEKGEDFVRKCNDEIKNLEAVLDGSKEDVIE